MEITIVFISSEPSVLYQNEISSNTSVLYEQTFLICFWFNVEDWKLVPGPFMILIKQQYSEIWPFFIVDILHF